MKQLKLPYHISEPPQAVKKARLDNIALVPASLLFKKSKYQRIANNLPKDSILICQTEQKQRIAPILDQVAAWLHKNGHFVKTLPYSLLV